MPKTKEAPTEKDFEHLKSALEKADTEKESIQKEKKSLSLHADVLGSEIYGLEDELNDLFSRHDLKERMEAQVYAPTHTRIVPEAFANITEPLPPELEELVHFSSLVVIDKTLNIFLYAKAFITQLNTSKMNDATFNKHKAYFEKYLEFENMDPKSIIAEIQKNLEQHISFKS